MTSPALPPSTGTSWYNWGQWVHDQATKIAAKLGVADLSATGTRSSTTVLHGDNTWKAVTSGGTVSDATDPDLYTITSGSGGPTPDATDLDLYTI